MATAAPLPTAKEIAAFYAALGEAYGYGAPLTEFQAEQLLRRAWALRDVYGSHHGMDSCWPERDRNRALNNADLRDPLLASHLLLDEAGIESGLLPNRIAKLLTQLGYAQPPEGETNR